MGSRGVPAFPKYLSTLLKVPNPQAACFRCLACDLVHVGLRSEAGYLCCTAEIHAPGYKEMYRPTKRADLGPVYKFQRNPGLRLVQKIICLGSNLSKAATLTDPKMLKMPTLDSGAIEPPRSYTRSISRGQTSPAYLPCTV